MTPQQEQELLRYVTVTGKKARCWHEWEKLYDGFTLYECLCGEQSTIVDGAIVCGPTNPTLTLDYLIQRCEEEGFNAKVHTYFEDEHCCAIIYTFDGERISHAGADKYKTPQQALLIALAKALGWKGEME